MQCTCIACDTSRFNSSHFSLAHSGFHYDMLYFPLVHFFITIRAQSDIGLCWSLLTPNGLLKQTAQLSSDITAFSSPPLITSQSRLAKFQKHNMLHLLVYHLPYHSTLNMLKAGPFHQKSINICCYVRFVPVS